MITIDQLAAHVDDDDLRLVYADAALGTGHPRGELVMIQHQLGQTPDDLSLAAREAELFAEHPEILLGELAGRWEPIQDDDARHPRDRLPLQLAWRLGFIEHARLQAGEGTPEPALVEALLSHPSGALMTRLDLGVFTWRRHVEFPEVTEPLFAGAPRSTLRTLEIGRIVEDGSTWGGPGHIYIDRDISAVSIGPLGRLWRAAPRLRELRLQGNHASFEIAPVAPELRVFELCTSSLGRADLLLLAEATWPALERCVLWFGDGDYGGGDCHVGDVATFLASLAVRAPRLQHLALANHAHTDALCDALFAAPPSLLANLRGLDVSLGTLGRDGGALLVAHRAALPSLVELNLCDSYLDEDMLEAIGRAYAGCTIFAGSQKDATEERYVAVAE